MSSTRKPWSFGVLLLAMLILAVFGLGYCRGREDALTPHVIDTRHQPFIGP